jgi:hypothetical protein
MSKAFYLNENFKNNLIEILSSNLKLNQLKKRNQEEATNDIGS